MAGFKIGAFSGISPKTPPRLLQDTQAQTADNCDVFRGSLRPMKGTGTAVTTIPAGQQTIYKFGQDSTDATAGWMYWSADVNVCRSQINGDTEEWTFYTGDGVPKAFRAGITNSPHPLAIPAPTTAVTLTLGTPPADYENLAQETRVYTYTYVYIDGQREFESAPAPASFSVDVYPGQTVQVTFSGSYSLFSGAGTWVKRLYRSTVGTYLLTAVDTYGVNIPILTSPVNDNTDPEDLVDELPSLTWLTPPDNLAGLTNMPNGVMAGFVGRDVYFCEPYIPHAWPDEYRQTLDYPVVGLGSIDTTLVVLTKGTPYIMQGSHPDSMVVIKSEIEQACVSKRSIVSMNNSVLYASPDGLISVSPGGSTILTLNVFTRDQWQDLDPSSIKAFTHDNKYIAFYDNGVDSGSFVFDFGVGQFSMNDTTADAGFNWLQGDTLYILNGTSIVPWNEGSDLTYTWKSKVFTLPRIMGMSCMQVEAEGYPVTAKVYAAGSLIHTQTVSNRDPFRLPAVMAKDWEVEVTGTQEIFNVAIAQSMEELANA